MVRRLSVDLAADRHAVEAGAIVRDHNLGAPNFTAGPREEVHGCRGVVRVQKLKGKWESICKRKTIFRTRLDIPRVSGWLADQSQPEEIESARQLSETGGPSLSLPLTFDGFHDDKIPS